MKTHHLDHTNRICTWTGDPVIMMDSGRLSQDQQSVKQCIFTGSGLSGLLESALGTEGQRPSDGEGGILNIRLQSFI